MAILGLKFLKTGWFQSSLMCKKMCLNIILDSYFMSENSCFDHGHPKVKFMSVICAYLLPLINTVQTEIPVVAFCCYALLTS